MNYIYEATTPVLLILLTIAACNDLVTKRIPNVLVLWGIGLAFALAGLSAGQAGLLASLGGLLLGGIALLPLYLLGGMGAGDVKLMAMAGAFLGPLTTLMAVMATLAAGMLLALAVIGAWLIMNSAFGQMTIGALRQRLPPRLRPNVPGVRPTHFPYAAAIALGSLFALWWPNEVIILGASG